MTKNIQQRKSHLPLETFLQKLGFPEPPDTIEYMHHEAVVTVLDRALQVGYGQGIHDGTYFDYPVQLLRIHTACIYTAACSDRDWET